MCSTNSSFTFSKLAGIIFPWYFWLTFGWIFGHGASTVFAYIFLKSECKKGGSFHLSFDDQTLLLVIYRVPACLGVTWGCDSAAWICCGTKTGETPCVCLWVSQNHTGKRDVTSERLLEARFVRNWCHYATTLWGPGGLGGGFGWSSCLDRARKGPLLFPSIAGCDRKEIINVYSDFLLQLRLYLGLC